VDAVQKSAVMGSFASSLLSNPSSGHNELVEKLFQQYFGKPDNTTKAASDKAKLTALTREDLAEELAPIVAGLKKGNYVVCGPASTDAFARSPLTAAFADPNIKTSPNITYVGDRFFHPEIRIDSTTPPALTTFEQSLVSGATLLHEASHQFAETEDVLRDGKKDRCYGRSACKSLPGNYAAANADSLSMFVMDLMIGINASGHVSGSEIDSLVGAGAPKSGGVVAAAAAGGSVSPATSSSSSTSGGDQTL
jgi:hypothetical protein